MGRHSRRGPAPKDDPADIAARRGEQRGARSRERSPDTGGGPAPEGAPARGVPRSPDGTPVHGAPRFPEGASSRGGHPEQREAGGGWGTFPGAGGSGVVLPRQRQAGRGPQAGPGPRQEYLDAFDAGREGREGQQGQEGREGRERREGHDGAEGIRVVAPRAGRRIRPVGEQSDLTSPAPAPGASPAPAPAAVGGDTPPVGLPAQRGGGKGRAFAGIAAAAVTTVLAVVVAGQVTEGHDGGAAQSGSATGQARDTHDGGPAPSASPSVATLTYEQKMDRTYPLGATLKGPGKFDAVPGFDKAPGKGQKYRYRVDIEQGLGLDGALFAEAVQKTLNDDRSWSHGGTRTFERISSGKPDFVITLASPGTTATWCAKSGLDTTEDNVSCDSAATQRVMINAYRWAQGSKTYGDKIHAYRQMLINHEVGHRLGHGHVTCQKDGELAPVMQQQTKFLDHDGIHCLPNPWPYPRS
ncbi:DUF3152 domain-containing protein [Streptomyces sp. NPDC052301]|uniref:DUF3152 domain-containing protein n=1 Tax=Streptomyces sp. NPDC052301 TaxID=3365687 RepID=UPI0037D80054